MNCQNNLIEIMYFEEWKDINFYNIKTGAYQISSFGRVFSNTSNKILSPAISNGYLTVQLSTNSGDRVTFYIHRLVAMAFISNDNPEIYVEVNHKNLHRNENYFYNLEWVTKEENIQHELLYSGHNIPQLVSNGKWGDGYSTYGENNGMSKLTENEVRIMLSEIEKGSSYKQAIIAAGLEVTDNMRYNLSHIVRGKRWKHISKEYNMPSKIPR